MAAKPVKNPWLKIPAADYENHMAHPGVGQSIFLEQLFKKALHEYDASTIALLGAATGTGLEHLDPRKTKKLTAVDINEEYLHILAQRFSDRIVGLSLVRADLEKCDLENGYYSLVFAGLIFEYVDPEILLQKITTWLHEKGTLVVVLQLSGPENQTVSASPYKSLQRLIPLMKLIPPDTFNAMAGHAGLKRLKEKTIDLESKKSFYVASYMKKDRGIK